MLVNCSIFILHPVQTYNNKSLIWIIMNMYLFELRIDIISDHVMVTLSY